LCVKQIIRDSVEISIFCCFELLNLFVFFFRILLDWVLIGIKLTLWLTLDFLSLLEWFIISEIFPWKYQASPSQKLIKKSFHLILITNIEEYRASPFPQSKAKRNFNWVKKAPGKISVNEKSYTDSLIGLFCHTKLY
jgi:hypothetical protein